MNVMESLEEEVASVIPVIKEHMFTQLNECKGVDVCAPEELEEKVRQIMTDTTERHNGFDKKRIQEIVDLYLSFGLSVYSTGSMGRQYTGNATLSAVMDLVNSIANQPSSFYEASQLPCVVEHVMGDVLNEYIGFDSSRFAMICTSGGSLANMTALLAARNSHYNRCRTEGISSCHTAGTPSVAMSRDAHYSLIRAVETIGIGTDNIVWLPIDEKRRIDINATREALDYARTDGKDVFCIVASTGTTAVGAIDPIKELATIVDKNNIWLHVDGCHGASLLLSNLHRQKLEGIEQADSVSWDAHKMLAVPSPCSLLFYKDKSKANEAFRILASYVANNHGNEYGNGELNFECTKRSTIMNLWVLWVMYGKKYFEERINACCNNSTDAYKILSAQNDFHTIHEPETNILCFRYIPKSFPKGMDVSRFQEAIRNELCSRGRFFISQISLDGVTALRVVIMNPRHRETDFKNLLDEIRHVGDAIIKNTNIN